MTTHTVPVAMIDRSVSTPPEMSHQLLTGERSVIGASTALPPPAQLRTGPAA